MKLAILCTMMKRFGMKGFYNSQEIGLGRLRPLFLRGSREFLWRRARLWRSGR